MGCNTVCLTRAQFLVKFFKSEYELDDLKKIFPESYKKIYSVYNMLSNADLKNDEIVSADYTDDVVSIEFDSKKTADKIAIFDSEEFGTKMFKYKLNIKNNRKIVFIKLSLPTE